MVLEAMLLWKLPREESLERAGDECGTCERRHYQRDTGAVQLSTSVRYMCCMRVMRLVRRRC